MACIDNNIMHTVPVQVYAPMLVGAYYTGRSLTRVLASTYYGSIYGNLYARKCADARCSMQLCLLWYVCFEIHALHAALRMRARVCIAQ